MSLEGNITSKQALKGILSIRQGIDGKDGYTPQKGIDYFDGEKGEQGEVSIAYADSHYSPSIVLSASGEAITTTDSAKVKPKNIKLYGKSTQDGIPIGESGSIEQKILTANIFNEDTAILSGDPKLRFPLTVGSFVWVKTDIEVKQGDVFYIYYSINGVFNAQSTFYINSVMASSGSDIRKVTNNIAHITWDGVLFVRMDLITYDGTETIDNLVISKVPLTEYEPYTEQPFTILTPNGLHGIGDASDHVDFEKGVLVRHFAEVVFDGSDDENWSIPTRKMLSIPIENTLQLGVHDYYKLLSNQYVVETYNNIANLKHGICITEGCIRIYDNVLSDGNVSTFTEHLKQNPLKVVYQLAEPIEIPLTEEEMAQYNSLVMNYPNTTIINSDNAYMEVEYVADTKKYVDSRPMAEIEADLSGYVKKEELGNYATKDHVEQEIANFDFIKIVTELPTTGLPNRTYLVAKTDTENNDLYDEYLWVNGKWEFVGTKTIEVELTDYAKKSELPTKTSELQNDSDFVTSEYGYSKTEIDTMFGTYVTEVAELVDENLALLGGGEDE